MKTENERTLEDEGELAVSKRTVSLDISSRNGDDTPVILHRYFYRRSKRITSYIPDARSKFFSGGICGGIPDPTGLVVKKSLLSPYGDRGKRLSQYRHVR